MSFCLRSLDRRSGDGEEEATHMAEISRLTIGSKCLMLVTIEIFCEMKKHLLFWNYR